MTVPAGITDHIDELPIGLLNGTTHAVACTATDMDGQASSTVTTAGPLAGQ